MTILANAAAGLAALAVWARPAWRGRWLWVLTALAQGVLAVEVTTGAALLSDERFEQVPRIHPFYGLVALATVMVAYSSRDAMRGRLELLYGLVGLFVMGLAIRAVVQVT